MKKYVGLVMLFLFLACANQSLLAQSKGLQGMVLYQETTQPEAIKQKEAQNPNQRTVRPNTNRVERKECILYFDQMQAIYQNHDSEKKRMEKEHAHKTKEEAEKRQKAETGPRAFIQEQENRRMQERAGIYQGKPEHRTSSKGKYNEKIYQNLEKDLKMKIAQFGDEIFLVQQDKYRKKWDITKETKRILNYECTKAVYKGKNEYIEAWFTKEMACPIGPAGYGNLPGLILEVNVNEGQQIMTARKVNLERPIDKRIFELPKGKQMNSAEFEEMKEYYEQQKSSQGEQRSTPKPIQIRQHR